MKKIFIKLLYTFIVLLIFTSCKENDAIKQNALNDAISVVKTEYAPDKRVALFNVEAIKQKGSYLLKGESNLTKAVSALKDKLKAKSISFIDSIQMLPSKELNGNIFGLVNISVANLRSKPKHSAELATQALLGTPVNILKREGSWSLIQTPDKYLAWVDDGGIVAITTSDLSFWKSLPKVIYTNITGSTYSKSNKESQIISDIVAGNILVLLDEENGFYKVEYPDGRIAFINKNEAQLYKDWLQKTKPSAESLIATSKKLMGLPYLWGGTSTKGVDCSGFTKTVYFLNGMVIPRDASQQVHTGELTDETKDFTQLASGDLLFFGRKATDSTAERVVHVGMWIGNNEFIHSSGKVKISSFNKNASNFDEHNLNRYLRSKRILNSKSDAIINLSSTALFKD
ncbi:C40 family peptidase [Wocania ichthyoenteri]|uniref:C40 family peptidase n=1 Tax=Wocania ichthyoenteri TaxID=1230531 RepID=UPI00053D9AFB|nr:C40 family peptidase [Wocania ichthyoenteri]